MSAPTLGLHAIQRARVRRRIKASAYLALRNAPVVHYTQGPARWQGIASHLRAYKGQFPHYADCSAFATWCHWDASLRYKPRDYVNGEGWTGGYTGTMADHGVRVQDYTHLKVGDLVLYGPAPTYEHVAVVVKGGPIGSAQVISHGSEAGPFLLPVRYRSDVGQIRRYLK